MNSRDNKVPERPKVRLRSNPDKEGATQRDTTKTSASEFAPPLPPSEVNLPPFDDSLSFDSFSDSFKQNDSEISPSHDGYDAHVAEPTPPSGRSRLPSDEPDVVPDTEVEYEYSPDTSYFFVFGVKGSGKTVLLSGLLYNLRARRKGDHVISLNDNDLIHERTGTELLDMMMESIPAGEWPRGTPTLRADSRTFPRHMHLHFKPKNRNNPDLKFCLMDMSGEDLERVRASEYETGRLNPGIDVLLDLPVQNLSFICVYPSVHDRYSHAQLSTYMVNFLNKLEARGKSDVPIILVVTQWDRVSDQYQSTDDFLEENAPLVWNWLHASGRDFAHMAFSIGQVNQGTNGYKYSPGPSNRLFEWMYESQMGVSLNEEVKQSTWEKLMAKIGIK